MQLNQSFYFTILYKVTNIRLKGEDKYKIFSLRTKEKTILKIEEISQETNRSRNEIINILIEYALENYNKNEWIYNDY